MLPPSKNGPDFPSSLRSAFTTRSLRERLAVFSLVVGCIMFVLVPALHFESTVRNGVDFKVVYSSSKCLLDRCDPYDSPRLVDEYVRGHGDLSPTSDMSAFNPYQALYPPSTLFWILPFAALPYKTALAVWMVLNGALFVLATFLIADLCFVWGGPIGVMLLGLFVASSTMLLSTAQPSALAISLCAIGVWSLLRRQYAVAGLLCFSLSLAIKPQLGGLVSLYFLLARGAPRRRAVLILFTAALLCVPGLAWVSSMPAAAGWPHELVTNIAGSSAPGAINDPGPTSYNTLLVTDLQSVVAVFIQSRPVYNRITWIFVGSLLVLWAYTALRSQASTRKHLLGIAAIACLSLLPIYHRHYDVRLLLLTFPACALLIAEGGTAGSLAIAVSVLLIGCSHPSFLRDHLHLHQEALSHWKTVLLLRTSPLVVTLCALFYLTLFSMTLLQEQRTRDEAH